MDNKEIVLKSVKKSDYIAFGKDIQEVFTVSAIEQLGDVEDERIPSDADINKSMNSVNAEAFYFLAGGEKIGGVVLNINRKTQHNLVDFLFIFRAHQGKGNGLAAWKAIEKHYPETKVWELGTPYFEKRNIHFYVNKCGFHIVEFYNKYHTDIHMNNTECPQDGEEDFFLFKKFMD